ncbi:MAG: winged helix-turn-helix domain-containing protein [Clostridia bacterium]|nr:winged helix-turn-helix domain-containing protein [Clostridia bacterium]
MEDFGLDKIRRESIKKIFSCIPADGNISRLEISEKTGLSLMTVGKITDYFLEKGVVKYAKSEDGGVGRKAKHISLSDEKNMIVLVPSKEKLGVVIVSFTLEKTGELELVPDKNDAVGSIMGELMPFIFEHGLVGGLVGVCAIYDKIDDIDYYQKLADDLVIALSLKVSEVCKSELAKISAVKKEQSTLYISKSEDGASVSFYGTEPMLGRISAKDKETLETKLSAITEFLSAQEIYSELELEKEFASYVSKEKAYELEYIGAAMLLREKYLFA